MKLMAVVYFPTWVQAAQHARNHGLSVWFVKWANKWAVGPKRLSPEE